MAPPRYYDRTLVEGRLGESAGLNIPPKTNCPVRQDLVIERDAQHLCVLHRVAGIWFIWSHWSVSFVWFDERERQDRPALRINRPESSFAACPDTSTFTIQH